MDNNETTTDMIEEVEVKEVETDTDKIVEEEPKKFGVLADILSKAVNPTETKVETEIKKEEPKIEHDKKKGLHEMSAPELQDEVKKWMSIAEKRKVEIERKDANKANPDEKYTKFIDGLKSDFFGAYNDFYQDFGLPSPQYLQNQLSTGGDRDTRIQQWQETELISAIEKKFKIEPGTFVPDPTELYKKGTPTEYFRRMTESKEAELDKAYQDEQNKKNTILSEIQQQRDKDLDYISKSFFSEDKQSFENKIKEFDEIPEKISKGELTQELNPFSIRNVFRGIYFDELADALVKKATSEIHKQYNSMGLYLPKGKVLPFDATQMSGSPKENKESPTKNSFSMINKAFNRTIKS